MTVLNVFGKDFKDNLLIVFEIFLIVFKDGT